MRSNREFGNAGILENHTFRTFDCKTHVINSLQINSINPHCNTEREASGNILWAKCNLRCNKSRYNVHISGRHIID